MIRPATQSDLPYIKNSAEAAYGPYVPVIGRKPAPMVADFASLIDQDSVWVCDGGFIVMFAQGDVLHIENVAVHPDMQGQGFGRRLMSFAEDHARSLGLACVELYTNAKMTGPLALYPRLGYRQTGRRIEDGFDRVYFAKTLSR